jgi:YhcH/YjgK/YiaL family protein
MIIDRIQRLPDYDPLLPGLAEVHRFLDDFDPRRSQPGRYAIDEPRLYAMLMDEPGKSADDAKLEIHRQYADVQLLIDGEEHLGWKPLADCATPVGDYDAEKDIRFFDDAPDTWVSLKPGQFILFGPGDAHAPLVAAGPVRKLVAKIALPATSGPACC